MARRTRGGTAARGAVPKWLVVLLLGAVGVTSLGYLRVAMVNQYYSYRYEDRDRDGVPNWLDEDMDGDGIPNVEDTDANGNGTPNAEDVVAAAREMVGRIYDIPGGMGLKFGDRLGLMNSADVLLVAVGKAGVFIEQVGTARYDPADEADAQPDIAELRDTTILLSRLRAAQYLVDPFYEPIPGDLVFFKDGYAGVVTEIDAQGGFKCVVALGELAKVVELTSKQLSAKGHLVRCHAQFVP